MEKNISESQIRFIKWMLKGAGISAAKKDISKKEREELDELVENKLAFKGKNHSGDSIGMYYIPEEEKSRIRNELKLNW